MRPTNQRLKELIASARADIKRTNSLDKRVFYEEEIAIMEELLMWRGADFDTMVPDEAELMDGLRRCVVGFSVIIVRAKDRERADQLLAFARRAASPVTTGLMPPQPDDLADTLYFYNGSTLSVHVDEVGLRDG